VRRDGDEDEPRADGDGVHYGIPPIFCEQCPDLAMAVVDGSPLCLRCTKAELEGRPEAWIARHARPLLVQRS
jgi:hypothetical protein